MKLKEIISQAQTKEKLAYEKYQMGNNNVILTNAMLYYMDMTNI